MIGSKNPGKLAEVTDPDFAQLESELYDDFPLPLHGLHGPRHWRRVDRYGRWLAARTGADLEVVRRFALFHDCQRFSEGHDPGHGARGARWAERYCTPELTEMQMRLLVLACEGHEMGFSSQDPTVGTCWDADRLDLDRVGLEVRPETLSTQPGRELARLPLDLRHRQAGLRGFFEGIDSLKEKWSEFGV